MLPMPCSTLGYGQRGHEIICEFDYDTIASDKC
jgi:hypothetical protein